LVLGGRGIPSIIKMEIKTRMYVSIGSTVSRILKNKDFKVPGEGKP